MAPCPQLLQMQRFTCPPRLAGRPEVGDGLSAVEVIEGSDAGKEHAPRLGD